MSFVGSNILAGASGQGGDSGYKIERSLRFNPADTPELVRTGSSAGNTSTFTISFWVKRSGLGTTQMFIQTGNTYSNLFRYYFDGNDNLRVHQYNGSSYVWDQTSVKRLRDTSAWYHIVLAVDTTQAVATNRVKAYVNGEEITEWQYVTNPAQNLTTGWNTNITQRIGREYTTTYGSHYLVDGYLTEFYNIDGQQLAATDFGEFDSNNVWQPKEFAGSYGTADVAGSSSPSVFYSEAPSYQDISKINSGSGPVGVNNANGGFIRLKFDSAQTGVTSIKFTGGGYASGAAFEVFVNGSSIGSYSTNSGWTEDSITISSTDITEIEFRTTSSGYALGQLKFNNSLVPGTPSLGTPGTGTNSFHLDFKDNSSVSALGTDTSGKGNNFTPNNFSVHTDTIYSALDTYPAADYSTVPAMMFDGIVNSSNSHIWYAATAGTVSLNGLAAKLPSYVTTIEIAGYDRYGTNTATINGTSYTLSHAAHPPQYSSAITINGAVTSFSISGTDTEYWGIAAIKVNGNILIDSAVETNDSLTDTPTNYGSDTGLGGEVRGNYCTWNPNAAFNSLVTYTNGNLEVSASASSGNSTSMHCFGTFAVPSGGKYYWEETALVNRCAGISVYPLVSGGYSLAYDGGVTNQVNGTASGSGASLSSSDVLGIALDTTNWTLTYYKNGTQFYQLTNITQQEYFPWSGCNSSGSVNSNKTNFGQRAWAHTPPSGYKALCTQNLPVPLVEDGSTYFDTKLYDGSSSAQTISGLNFSPDLVWIKTRSTTEDHYLFDEIRGVQKWMSTNNRNADATNANSLTSFNSDGFTVGTASGSNWNGRTFASWNWDAGDLVSTSNSNINSSQTWSNAPFFAATNGAAHASTPDKAFDGSTAYGNVNGVLPQANSTFNWDFSSVFSSATSVTIKTEAGGSASNRIKVNGNDISVPNGNSSITVDVTGVGFNSLQQNHYGSDYCYIFDITVDGVLLVNPGVVPAGSISSGVPTMASTVRANPSAGFSIVNYAGNGVQGASFAHGLNAVPEMVITKCRDSLSDWAVFHTSLGVNWTLQMHLTNPANNWTDTFPAVDSNTVTVGTWNAVNTNNQNMLAYCFAGVEGYSKFGKYVGNGSTDGPFVYTGFRPRWLMIKNTSSNSDWSIIDTERDPYNLADNYLLANSSGAEGSPGYFRDYLSNGFKIRDNGSGVNTNGNVYVFAAFAENPFKTSRAR